MGRILGNIYFSTNQKLFIFQPIRNRQIVFSRARVDEQTFARHFLLENFFRSWHKDFSMLHSTHTRAALAPRILIFIASMLLIARRICDAYQPFFAVH
jgi:hypothetical protein